MAASQSSELQPSIRKGNTLIIEHNRLAKILIAVLILILSTIYVSPSLNVSWIPADNPAAQGAGNATLGVSN